MYIVYKFGLKKKFNYDYLEIELKGNIFSDNSEQLDVTINGQNYYSRHIVTDPISKFTYESKSGKEYNFVIESKTKYIGFRHKYIVHINGEEVYNN